jgi:hypothetical protein
VANGRGNECHDDKGKFCSEGGSPNVERTSDTRAEQPAESKPVKFTDARFSEGAAHSGFVGTKAGKKEAIAEANKLRALGYEVKVMQRDVEAANADLRRRGIEQHRFFEVHVIRKK